MKRLLLSIITVVLVLGAISGGTWAYLNDTEVSNGNTFTAGTFDLTLTDPNEGPAPRDGVTATWVMNNMVPGTTTSVPYGVTLSNYGSVEASHVEIRFSHLLVEEELSPESDTNTHSTAGDMARFIEIKMMSFNSRDFVEEFIPLSPDKDPNHNGWFDLEDVTLGSYAAEGGILDNLHAPNGGTRTLMMKFFFRSEAEDDIQGDQLTTTVTFTLNQDASQ